MKTIIALISFILLFAACEDVIEMDLNSIEPKLVIEGSINDIDDQCSIKISKTSDYFNPGTCPTVSDATVSVTDENGMTTNFKESAPGIYTSDDIQVMENIAYTLNVNAENESYTAEITMPSKVNIDSLSFESTPPFLEFEGGYVINFHFSDPEEYTNYYRLKVCNLSDPLEAEERIFVFNDDFVNGNHISIMWDVEQFLADNIIAAELLTLNKATYDYYFTLNSITGGSMMGSSNPANPVTNIDNEALGFFGSYTVSRDTIVISPSF